MGKERILYKEVVAKDKRVLSNGEQEDPHLMLRVISTEVVEATKEEIQQAKETFLETGICPGHLIYDEDTFMYYSRYCGICGQFIAFI